MAAVIAGFTGPSTCSARRRGGDASATCGLWGSGSEGVFAVLDGGGVPALLPFSGRLAKRLLVLVYAYIQLRRV
jgi:hypothetical protein